MQEAPGIYRAGPAAPGLPLPRAHLRLVTMFVIVLAALALVAPLALLAATRGHVKLRMQEGGLVMWGLLLVEVLAPVVVGLVGLLVVRGKNYSSFLLFGVASVPFALFLYGGLSGTQGMLGTLKLVNTDAVLHLR